MELERLKEIVMKKTEHEDEKIVLSCENAFVISKEHKVSLDKISQVCNKNKIKISKCQLKCFQ